MVERSDITQVRVISIAGAAERRSAFEQRAAGASIDWQFFDAWTSQHPSLTYEPADVKGRLVRELTAGVIGCFSSHFALWEELDSSAATQFFLIEDDVIIDWNFLAELSKIEWIPRVID